jgi:hypothetical protein
MVTQNDMNAAFITVTTFLNLSLAAIFLYFRLKTGETNLTKAQKWTLTILFWIFLLNGLHQVFDIFTNYTYDYNLSSLSYYVSRLTYDVDILIAGMLLSLGLVYPRPYTKWKTLERYLMMIVLFCAVIMFFWMALHYFNDLELGEGGQLPGYLYLVGWFVPIFMWLPEYEKQTSDQSRMIYTLLIWGLFCSPLAQGLGGVIANAYGGGDVNLQAFVMFFLSMIVLIFIVRALVRKQGGWARAEWINLGFIVFYVLMSFINYGYGILVYGSNTFFLKFFDPTLFWLNTIVGISTWAVVRPVLFAYGMLRYQLFGSQLRGERFLSVVFASSLAFSFGALATFWLYDGIGPAGAFGAGALVGAVLLFPLWRAVGAMILKLLPMSGGSEKTSMVERRATYLLGLQSAVVNGRIDDPEDKLALERLQKDLSISQREHDLLMESHSLRAQILESSEGYSELFLILSDGRLINHQSEDKSSEQDKDVMAGMLIAIRGFVEEGFKGDKRSLDSIRYGDFSLGIETEHNLVLAGLKKGPLSSEDRQRLRDALGSIWDRFGSKLEQWDGSLDALKGVEDDLVGLVEKAPVKS